MAGPARPHTLRDKFLQDFWQPATTLDLSNAKGALAMQVLVNTSNGIENKKALELWADDYLNAELARFRQEITCVEVQLSDENKLRNGGSDKRCMMAARLNGHEPVAVNHHAETQDLAFRGATEKLIRKLKRTLGKLDRHEHRVRHTIRKDSPIATE
jgi:ribosome-associated translation inhibitor RaiA